MSSSEALTCPALWPGHSSCSCFCPAAVEAVVVSVFITATQLTRRWRCPKGGTATLGTNWEILPPQLNYLKKMMFSKIIVKYQFFGCHYANNGQNEECHTSSRS